MNGVMEVNEIPKRNRLEMKLNLCVVKLRDISSVLQSNGYLPRIVSDDREDVRDTSKRAYNSILSQLVVALILETPILILIYIVAEF